MPAVAAARAAVLPRNRRRWIRADMSLPPRGLDSYAKGIRTAGGRAQDTRDEPSTLHGSPAGLARLEPLYRTATPMRWGKRVGQESAKSSFPRFAWERMVGTLRRRRAQVQMTTLRSVGVDDINNRPVNTARLVHYVGCSPCRVPITRLAAAQAAIKAKKRGVPTRSMGTPRLSHYLKRLGRFATQTQAQESQGRDGA